MARLLGNRTDTSSITHILVSSSFTFSMNSQNDRKLSTIVILAGVSSPSSLFHTSSPNLMHVELFPVPGNPDAKVSV
jgi:hypothetical protein